jgi:hypothetical protein
MPFRTRYNTVLGLSVLGALAAGTCAAGVSTAGALPRHVVLISGTTSQYLRVDVTYNSTKRSVNGFRIRFRCAGKRTSNQYIAADGGHDTKVLARVSKSGRVRLTRPAQVRLARPGSPTKSGSVTIQGKLTPTGGRFSLNATARVRSPGCSSGAMKLRAVSTAHR